MNTRTCEGCGTPINLHRSHARTCSPKCRVRVHRAAKLAQTRAEVAPIPTDLRELDRWVRWTNRPRNGRMTKAPVTTTGRAASSTNPATWSTYTAAADSTIGDGLGFVLNGDGLACIDLDHCLTDGKPSPAAQAVLERFPGAWVEVSPSGDGLHIWGTAPGGPGRKITTTDGLSIEFYTTGRYMTVTGNTYRQGTLTVPLSITDLA